jgi:hypothetical protein
VPACKPDVLHVIGDKGREGIREMFQRLDEKAKDQSKRGQETYNVSHLGPVVQTLRYFATPRTIVKFDIDDLVLQAQKAAAVSAYRADKELRLDQRCPARVN